MGVKGLKTPSSADNRLIDTTQTAREESEIFIRKPEVRDPLECAYFFPLFVWFRRKHGQISARKQLR